MSYRCQSCKALHEGPSLQLVNKTRPVKYEYFTMKMGFDENRNKVMKPCFEYDSTGTEIKQEQFLCDDCYDKFRLYEPTVDHELKTVRSILPKTETRMTTNEPRTNDFKTGNHKSFKDAFTSKRKGRKYDSKEDNYGSEDYE